MHIALVKAGHPFLKTPRPTQWWGTATQANAIEIEERSTSPVIKKLLLVRENLPEVLAISIMYCWRESVNSYSADDKLRCHISWMDLPRASDTTQGLRIKEGPIRTSVIEDRQFSECIENLRLSTGLGALKLDDIIEAIPYEITKIVSKYCSSKDCIKLCTLCTVPVPCWDTGQISCSECNSTHCGTCTRQLPSTNCWQCDASLEYAADKDSEFTLASLCKSRILSQAASAPQPLSIQNQALKKQRTCTPLNDGHRRPGRQ